MYVSTGPRQQYGLTGFFPGLGDTSSVQAQIVAAAGKYGVDPNLALAVAKQESGYNPNALSSAGAIGTMQLMPATAAGLGVNPNDPAQNIDGGVKYLSQLLNQFNGNVSNALAAYNAGPGAVQKYGGVPPYAETQNYVSSILANYNAMGGGASSDSSGSGVDAGATSPTNSGFDLSSLFPGDPSLLSQQYNLGGLVLSGSDLFTIALASAGILLISSIL